MHSVPIVLAQQSGVHQQAGDNIGVKVGSGPAVLIVATLLDRHHAANANTAATVCYPVAVVVDG